MENLWPKSLFKGVVDPTIEQYLVDQAEGIWLTSKGLVTGVVRDRSIAPSRAWSFALHPTRQSAKATDVLIVRSEHGSFPAVIQVFYDGPQFRKVGDLAEMRGALKTIFSSDGMKKVVELLGMEALEAGVLPDGDRKRAQAPEPRSFSIGKVVRTNQGSFAQVAFAGVAGFVSEDDIQRLLMKPDELDSPIESFDGRYVFTIKFLDSCKFSLSAEELRVLKAEAKKSLD